MKTFKELAKRIVIENGIPHWELKTEYGVVSCDFSDVDLKETIKEIEGTWYLQTDNRCP